MTLASPVVHETSLNIRVHLIEKRLVMVPLVKSLVNPSPGPLVRTCFFCVGENRCSRLKAAHHPEVGAEAATTGLPGLGGPTSPKSRRGGRGGGRRSDPTRDLPGGQCKSETAGPTSDHRRNLGEIEQTTPRDDHSASPAHPLASGGRFGQV